jgi:hypothetical protein
MAITGWSTSNYLTRAAAVWPQGLPFLVSGWAQVVDADTAGSDPLYELGQTDSNNRRVLFRSSSGQTVAISRATSNGTATSGGSTAKDVWANHVATFNASNLRRAYLNGGNRQGDSTNIGPASPTHTYLGIRSNGTGPFPPASGLAEVSVWDTDGFSDEQHDALAVQLAAGDSPIAINEDSGDPAYLRLVAYWRLLNTSDLNDYSGNGHHLTQEGSLSNFASHPAVDDPPAPPLDGFPHSQAVIIT